MRRGGSYVMQPDGTRQRTAGTADHPESNGPRTADGRLIVDGVAAPPPPPPTPPAADDTAARKRKD